MSYYQPESRGPDPRDQRGSEPGWQALAEANASADRRRKRMFVVGAAAGAMVLAGTGVAIAQLVGGRATGSRVTAQGRVTSSGSADVGQAGTVPGAETANRPSPSGTATGSRAGTGTAASPPAPTASVPGGLGAGAAASTASPPPSPSARPTQVDGPEGLSAEAVLYAQKIQVGGRTYTRELAAEKSPCSLATTGQLGDVLAPDGCSQLLRATWVSGDHAVTVGIGVLPDAAAAQAANAVYVGHVEPLLGGGVPGFCPDQVACALQHGAYGRFTYYVIAGPVGSAAGAGDPASIEAADQLGAFALEALKRQ